MLQKMPRSGPSPSSSADPTTGPSRMPSDRAVEFSLMALGRSAGPTKSSSMSCSAGIQIAPAMPCRTSSTQAFQTRSVPVANSSPQHADTDMNSSCAPWMSLRQSCRSASAPKYGDSSRNGSQWLNTSKPVSAGEWNFSHSTQYVMTCSTLSAIIASAPPSR